MASVYTVRWSPQDRMEQNRPIRYLLHDPRTTEYQILEPYLIMKKTSAGEFSFTIPKTHPDYDAIQGQGSLWDVLVYKNDRFLWAGHPLTMETDLYGNCKITCEGILGYLSDICLEPFSITASVGWVFDRIMTWYKDGMKKYVTNQAVMLHRTFAIAYAVGQFPADGDIVRHTRKCMTAMEAIRTKLVDYYGGWLELTESGNPENGIWNLTYHPESSDTITQTLEIGRNILELNRYMDYTDFATALVPVDSSGNAVLVGGMEHWNSEWTGYHSGDVDYRDVVSPANSCLCIKKSLADKYGIITRIYTEDAFDEEEPSDMRIYYTMLPAVSKLAEPSATIEVRAVDLSVIDDAEEAITVGCRVRAILTPGGMPEVLTVDSLSLRLDDPTQNTVTLNGTLRSFTERR